jgi:hypothetical protein
LRPQKRPEHFYEFYEDLMVESDTNVYQIKMDNLVNDTTNCREETFLKPANKKTLSKQEIKEVYRNNNIPVVILNPTLEYSMDIEGNILRNRGTSINSFSNSGAVFEKLCLGLRSQN